LFLEGLSDWGNPENLAVFKEANYWLRIILFHLKQKASIVAFKINPWVNHITPTGVHDYAT
jgi:hypothetical protein